MPRITSWRYTLNLFPFGFLGSAVYFLHWCRNIYHSSVVLANFSITFYVSSFISRANVSFLLVKPFPHEKRKMKNFWSNSPENIHVFHWTLYEWREFSSIQLERVRTFVEVCGCAASFHAGKFSCENFLWKNWGAHDRRQGNDFSFINVLFLTLEKYQNKFVIAK